MTNVPTASLNTICVLVCLTLVDVLYGQATDELKSHLKPIRFKARVVNTQHTPAKRFNRFELLEDSNTKSLYVLQMRTPILPWHKDLVEHILDNEPLHHYIPDNAFIVSATKQQAHSLLVDTAHVVVWIQEFTADLKIESQNDLHLLNDNFDDSSNLLSSSPEFVVKLIRFKGHRNASESSALAVDWPFRAFANLGLLFNVKGVVGDKLLVSNVRYGNGSSIMTYGEKHRLKKWLCEQHEVVSVAQRETYDLTRYAKSLMQNDVVDVRAVDEQFVFEAHGISGQSEIIGIGDSGLDPESCFFKDNDRDISYTSIDDTTDPSTMTASLHRKVALYVVDDSGDNVDSLGHGSHVAGILAGQVDSGDGAQWSDFNGMADQARLAFYDIMQGEYITVPLSLDLQYFPFMAAVGAYVHSNSWGASGEDSQAQYTDSCVDVDQFAWDNKDACLLFAAGNSGESGSGTVSSPGSAKNVIAVGATLNSAEAWTATYCGAEALFPSTDACEASKSWGDDIQNELATFSSQGPTADGRIKPDVVAVGQQVISSNNQGCIGQQADIRADQGSSMSCPTVAGSIALMRQYFTEGFYPTGRRTSTDGFTPSGALLKAATINGAFAITHRQAIENDYLVRKPLSEKPNNFMGFGRPRFNRALFFDDDTKEYHKFMIARNGSTEPTFTQADETHSYTFCVTHVYSRHPPRFTLVWTDYPATTIAESAIVNDLDLSAITDTEPNTILYPNGLTELDKINTVERIELPSSVEPNVEIVITVNAYAVLFGPQPYALVSSGRIISTTCLEEFPDGVVPADRYVDVSEESDQITSAPDASLLDIDFTDPETQFVFAVAALFGLFIACCLGSFCACIYNMQNHSSSSSSSNKYNDNDGVSAGAALLTLPQSTAQPQFSRPSASNSADTLHTNRPIHELNSQRSVAGIKVDTGSAGQKDDPKNDKNFAKVGFSSTTNKK